MLNRNSLAKLLFHVPAEKKGELFLQFRKDETLVTRYLGTGNKAVRRMGEVPFMGGCNCDVCVVYGGDCSYSMAQEDRRDWHRSQRGVKTRGR